MPSWWRLARKRTNHLNGRIYYKWTNRKIHSKGIPTTKPPIRHEPLGCGTALGLHISPGHEIAKRQEKHDAPEAVGHQYPRNSHEFSPFLLVPFRASGHSQCLVPGEMTCLSSVIPPAEWRHVATFHSLYAVVVCVLNYFAKKKSTFLPLQFSTAFPRAIDVYILAEQGLNEIKGC